MIRIYPKLEDDLFVGLYHKARKSQWTSADIDWRAPVKLDDRQKVALARILTPVYLGEQAAMLGAASVIPQMANAHETSAQLYLSTFLMDEARHFEALTRLYQHLGHDPIGLREMPDSLRYHHRLRSGDRFDWVWGILISDIFSSLFYQTFARVQPDALFGRISANVLQDESRHKAFAHYYLRWAMPRLPEERRRGLRQMKDELLRTMEAMHTHLRDDAKALGIDSHEFFARLISHVETHAERIGLVERRGRKDDRGPEDWAAGGGGDGARVATAGGSPGGDLLPPGGWAQFFRLLLGLEPMPVRIFDGRGNLLPEPVPVGPVFGKPAQAASDAPAEASQDRRPARRYVSFGRAVTGFVHACTGCAVALLCRSRLVRAAEGAG